MISGGRRNLVSFTRTVLKTQSILSTRTFYRTRTTTRAVIAGLAQRDLKETVVADSAEEKVEDADAAQTDNTTFVESEPADPGESDNDPDKLRALFARNLCPTCPLGAPVVPLYPGRTFENAGPPSNAFRACCTRRGTVRTTQTHFWTRWTNRRIVKTKTVVLRLPRVRFQHWISARRVSDATLPFRTTEAESGRSSFQCQLER